MNFWRIGVSVKRSYSFKPEQKDVLWNKNLLKLHSSKNNINIKFYHRCKLLRLWDLDKNGMAIEMRHFRWQFLHRILWTHN